MKRILMIILSIMLLAMTGCTDSGNANTTKAFIGGSSGLDITFAENQPPDKVMDNNQESFGIAVMLKNVGEATVPTGKVIATLSGLDANAFSIQGITATNQNAIGKKEKDGSSTIDGGTEAVEFGDASYMPKLTGDQEVPIRATVCYNYETDAVFSTCLKRNTVQRSSDKDVCTIDETKATENSGAPVHVSDVRESRGGNNLVKLSFDVTNIGSGSIYAPDTFTGGSGCIDDTSNANRDKVTVIIEPKSNIAVSCSRLNGGNQGTIKLYNGKGTVVCEIDTTGLQETAYVNQLNIMVKYTYLDSVEKKLVVQKS